MTSELEQKIHELRVFLDELESVMGYEIEYHTWDRMVPLTATVTIEMDGSIL